LKIPRGDEGLLWYACDLALQPAARYDRDESRYNPISASASRIISLGMLVALLVSWLQARSINSKLRH